MPGDRTVLLATRPGAGRRPSRPFPTGRVCATEGCGTWLSIYNGESRCWIHKSVHSERIRNGEARGGGLTKRQDTLGKGR
jgi:hypothetical protein